MTKVYLAHSAHEREQGKDIEARLTKAGYDVHNPFDVEGNDKAFWNENNEVIWNGQPNLEACDWIIDVDLQAVRKADIVVMIMPQDLLTFGCTCEMFYAYMNKIPIFSYVPEAVSGHPWIVGCCRGQVWTDLEELMVFLEARGDPLGSEELLVDILADLEHEQWRHWSSNIANEEDISRDRLNRWAESDVPFDSLSDYEKEHDRVWARKVIAQLKELGIEL